MKNVAFDRITTPAMIRGVTASNKSSFIVKKTIRAREMLNVKNFRAIQRRAFFLSKIFLTSGYHPQNKKKSIAVSFEGRRSIERNDAPSHTAIPARSLYSTMAKVTSTPHKADTE